MALVTVTPAAVRQVERQLALKPLSRPVLAVMWSPGQKDVKRGRGGETIWETTEEVGWKVNLLDWSEMPDDDFDMGPIERVRGIEVWFHSYGREDIAEVVVDHNNGKYVVSERAI
jgi:hypothetical protein